MTARERVAPLVAQGLDPCAVACALVDEDVAGGEYDGCSPELELAYLEYEALARRMGGE